MHAGVADVAFTSSEPLTLGIEEEFLLVDPVDGVRPAAVADALLDGGWETIAAPGGWLKPEMLRCSVELATAANASMQQLDVDLHALRDELARRAGAAGAQLVGIGLHPDLAVDDPLVSPTDAHQAIAALHHRVGTLTDQSTHGIHVHVGVPTLDDAVRTMDALAACVPLLVALGACSPVAAGRRSPWRSHRSEVLRRMHWAGATPHFDSPGEYRAVHALHQLENAGDQRFLWDVAPVPALGTVEVRSIDASPDPHVALAMAALVQSIAALVLDGGRIDRANESLERHNRWSAMEFGTRARFLVPGRDEPVDVAQLVHELLERVRPYARDLGSQPWLATIEHLLEDPPVERAIEAFEAGGCAALIAHVQLTAGVPDPGDT
jgi:glutamate---cysteine ligase / carboxylate-amine ligase